MEKDNRTWADVARELVLNPEQMGKHIESFGSYMEEYMPGFKARFDAMESEDKVLFVVGLMKEMDSKGLSPMDESSPESHQL